jgi:signal peptidase II
MQAARGTALTGPVRRNDTGRPDIPSLPDLPGGGGARRPAAPRRVGILIAVALGVLGLDIASKVTVVAELTDGRTIRLLGGFLTLRQSRNPGAAFSIGTSQTIVFTLIAVGVIIFILRTSRRIHSLPWAIALGLLLGGATGNLADRIFRYPGPLRGYVVDWIQVPHWPVFNLADSAIVCGGALAVLLATRGIRIEGPAAGDPSPGLGGQPGGGA